MHKTNVPHAQYRDDAVPGSVVSGNSDGDRNGALSDALSWWVRDEVVERCGNGLSAVEIVARDWTGGL